MATTEKEKEEEEPGEGKGGEEERSKPLFPSHRPRKLGKLTHWEGKSLAWDTRPQTSASTPRGHLLAVPAELGQVPEAEPSEAQRAATCRFAPTLRAWDHGSRAGGLVWRLLGTVILEPAQRLEVLQSLVGLQQLLLLDDSL